MSGRRALLAAGLVLLAAVALLGLLSRREDATPDAVAGPGRAAAPATGPDAGLLKAGNVLLLAGPGTYAAAQRLAREVAGSAATPDLRAAGQAVVVRRADEPGVLARAYAREERGTDAAAVHAFVEHWLGRGGG